MPTALRPCVVLLCGVPGAGKTTMAQEFERDGYVRLSIDEELWARFGRFGIDYPPARYQELSDEAEAALRERLVELVRTGRDVVLDFSFPTRADREGYKRLVESAGGRWRLLYLEVDREVLLGRLRGRSSRFDANAAFPIGAELLDTYLARFTAPAGEGEEVVGSLTPPDTA